MSCGVVSFFDLKEGLWFQPHSACRHLASVLLAHLGRLLTTSSGPTRKHCRRLGSSSTVQIASGLAAPRRLGSRSLTLAEMPPSRGSQTAQSRSRSRAARRRLPPARQCLSARGGAARARGGRLRLAVRQCLCAAAEDAANERRDARRGNLLVEDLQPPPPLRVRREFELE